MNKHSKIISDGVGTILLVLFIFILVGGLFTCSLDQIMQNRKTWKFIGMAPGMELSFSGEPTGRLGYRRVLENTKTGARKIIDTGFYVDWPFENEQELLDKGFTLDQIREADGTHFIKLPDPSPFPKP